MNTQWFKCCLGGQHSIAATLNVLNCCPSGPALNCAVGTIEVLNRPANICGWPSFITWLLQLARMCFYASWVVGDHNRPT